MELLDRYLNAVRFWLPNAQQEDIIAELGEDIRSQVEETEASLGRKLNDDDLAAILRQRGHPMLMAGRYVPQQSLIGPVLYPAYLVVMKILVLWILVPIFVLIVAPVTIATTANPTLASIQTLWNLAMAAVFSVGVVTVVFAILERRPIHELEKWDPLKLPRVPKMTAAQELSLKAPGPTTRVNAIAELVFGVITTGVWIQAIRYRAGFDLNTVHITPAHIWTIVYWPIFAICLAGVPLGWTGLVWPSGSRLRAVIRFGIDAVTLGVIGVLAGAGSWLKLTSATISMTDLATATHWTDVGMKITLASAAIITLIDAIREVRRFLGYKP